MQYKKYKNQAGMNLNPHPPSQNYYYYIFDAVVRFKIDIGFSPSLGLVCNIFICVIEYAPSDCFYRTL